MSSAKPATDNDVQQLGERLTDAKRIFDRQSERIDDLKYEAAEAALARDRAVYYLFRFCEAVHRGQITLDGDELKEVNESALEVLFDNNVFVGLDEPDAAILRVMEVATSVQEGRESAHGYEWCGVGRR